VSERAFTKAKLAYIAKKRVAYATDAQSMLNALTLDALYESDKEMLPCGEAFLDLLEGVHKNEVNELCREIFSHPIVIIIGNNTAHAARFEKKARTAAYAFVRGLQRSRSVPGASEKINGGRKNKKKAQR